MHPSPFGGSNQNQNRGYYVFVHEDDSPAEEVAAVASVANDGLEWDEEVAEEYPQYPPHSPAEDDTWTSLYKCYAQMLEHTDDLSDNANRVDIRKRGAAHYAAEQGHAGVLRLLLKTDCKIDSIDADGQTPLHLAVRHGQTAAVKVLLEAKVSVNRCVLNSEGHTALHLAAINGNVSNIEILAAAGALLEVRDNIERTPLHLAAEELQTEAAIKLLEIGSNVNVEDVNGITPLCAAVWQNCAELVAVLLSAGARIPPHHYLLHHAVLNKLVEVVTLLVRHGSNVNLRNNDGDTALLIASRSGQAQIARVLLENGASVDYPNSLTGSTALHEAVVCTDDYAAFQDVFLCLQQYQVNLNAICFSGGDTPLFRALLLGKDKVAKLLIKNGADVNLCSLHHCVVDNLSLAIARRSMSVARLIVLAGAQPPKEWGYHPRPLTHLARLTLRNHFPSTILCDSIRALPLPRLLKGFLMFENEEETDFE